MIDSSLRKLQLFELGILKDIDKVCKKNNIRYFLYAGTCLGAVRHKGFIPWDDDIDIAMHVADYVRFLEISQKELGEEYFLQTHDTDPDYPFMFAKIRKNHTTMIPSWKKDYSGHHGIWVDINPLIYVSSKLDFRLKRYMITYTNMLCMNGPVYLSEKNGKSSKKSISHTCCCYLRGSFLQKCATCWLLKFETGCYLPKNSNTCPVYGEPSPLTPRPRLIKAIPLFFRLRMGCSLSRRTMTPR